MTRRRLTKAICALTTLAVVALTFELTGGGGFGGISAGASTVSFVCQGATNDSGAAGNLGGAPKTSAELLLALQSFAHSGPLSLPINVGALDAPAKRAKGSAPFVVHFGVSVQLDPALGALVKQYIGPNVNIVNANVTVQADLTGQTATGHIPNQTINVDQGSGTTTFAMTVNPTSAGRIRYRALSISLGIAINNDVLGAAHIGTLSVSCGFTGDNIVGSTVIQVPGAPDVADLRYQGHWGINFFKLLDGQAITPDDGNPILPDTLRLTSPIPISHGLAATKDGWLAMLLGYQGYTDDVNMNICAPSRVVPAEPGSNDSWELAFPQNYTGNQGNAQLLFFTLKVNGKTTKRIDTSFKNVLTGIGLGGPIYEARPTIDLLNQGWSPLDLGIPGFLGWDGEPEFRRPPAAQIQAALEGAVGAGNVKVTDGPPDSTKPAPYEIQFTGALAEKAVGPVTISDWDTTFSHTQGENIFTQASALASGGGSGPAVPTVDELWHNVQTPGAPNYLDVPYFFAHLGDALGASLGSTIKNGIDVQAALGIIESLWPKGPALKNTGAAVATIPATTTGPLCTPFSANVVTPKVPDNIVAFFTALANGTFNHPQVAGASACKARVKVRVKVRSHGHTRTVTRTVTKSVPCKKKRH